LSAEIVKIFRPIFVAFLLLVAAIVVADPGNGGGNGKGKGGPNGKEKRSDRSKDGEYTIAVSGYYKGTGTATVSPDNVSITANVQHDGGPTLTLTAPSLKVDGPYFIGDGTVEGNKITVKGRLDAARMSRLAATYNSAQVRGRIAGTFPGDTPDDDWKDDKKDKGKDKGKDD